MVNAWRCGMVVMVVESKEAWIYAGNVFGKTLDWRKKDGNE